MSLSEAQKIADNQGYDLVLMSASSNPVVCKIMDYSKYKFDSIKKEKELRKNQKIIEVKEIQLSMTISDHDISYRVKSATKFLQEGNKVKVTLRMRGRQTAFASQGVEVMNDFFENLKEVAVMEKKPSTEGRSIIMVLAPANNK